jgi:hypothetical protein
MATATSVSTVIKHKNYAPFLLIVDRTVIDDEVISAMSGALINTPEKTSDMPRI